MENYCNLCGRETNDLKKFEDFKKSLPLQPRFHVDICDFCQYKMVQSVIKEKDIKWIIKPFVEKPEKSLCEKIMIFLFG